MATNKKQCQKGYVWNGNVCVPEKKTPGPLSPMGAKIGLGTIALGSAVAGVKAVVSKVKAKKALKKSAESTTKPTMKKGGKKGTKVKRK